MTTLPLRLVDTTERYLWTDRLGRVTELPVLAGAEGLGLPPTRLDSRVAFREAGERRLQQEHDAREIFLPVGVQPVDCPPRQALRTLLRDLGCRVDTTISTGVLRVELDGVPAREIEASLVEGMSLTVDSSRVQTVGLTFRAHEPYWRGVEDVVFPFATGEGLPFFANPDPSDPMIGNPFPPFQLSTVAITGGATVNVSCDASVWPRWVLTGPAEDVTLLNVTTDEAILLPGLVLDVGETLHIDTRPGVKTVLDGDGVNRYPSLAPESTLFELAPGPNDLLLFVDGATFNTALELRYRERFLTF